MQETLRWDGELDKQGVSTIDQLGVHSDDRSDSKL
jgi:hypothetical protein